jgi:hypothetical protein
MTALLVLHLGKVEASLVCGRQDAQVGCCAEDLLLLQDLPQSADILAEP